MSKNAKRKNMVNGSAQMKKKNNREKQKAQELETPNKIISNNGSCFWNIKRWL
jgi:hypothetical protein